MKVAITGAAGFLGNYVLSELQSQRNIEIIAIIRPGRTNLIDTDKIKYKYLDIANPPENVFDIIGKPDVLIHLAWGGLPNYHSLHHYEIELPAHYTFLKMLVTQGLKTLVIPGTCFEYGMQSGPLSSDMETQPDNAYGFAKDTLRKQLQFFQKTADFNFIWARLFYMYGAGQAETSLYSQLCKAVENGEKKFKMSGGEQLRDYMSVSEVARQIVMLAKQEKNIGVLNICSGRPQSVRSLVLQWIEDNNWDITLELGYYPYPDYEPMAFWGVGNRYNENIDYEGRN